MTNHTCRCTTCRCEMPDEDDALPICAECHEEPDATVDREAVERDFQRDRERPYGLRLVVT